MKTIFELCQQTWTLENVWGFCVFVEVLILMLTIIANISP